MKTLLTTILLLLTLSVSSQNKDVVKFSTDRFSYSTKIDEEWNHFSQWSLIEEPELITVKGLDNITHYSGGKEYTYEVFDYEYGNEGKDSYIRFNTIDSRGNRVEVLLTEEFDENGDKWDNAYFFYDDIKIVYSLY